MMKRTRFAGGEEVESVSMANVLVLISRGGKTNQSERPAPAPPSRVFECKTCSRRFLSFQALGGHRASHKKPRVGGEGQGMKPKVHECSICGLEFGIGQALGGHMRRHRAAATVGAGGFRQSVGAEKGYGRRGAWLDLNLPPLDESEMECLEMGFGLETVDKIRLVDCFH